MSDGARITLSFLGFIMASLAFVSLVFPEQVAERISSIKSVSVSPKQINIELAASTYQTAAKDRGEPIPSDQQAKAMVEKLVSSSRILWVDDKPGGNKNEIAVLRELGHSVDQVATNNDAMRYYSLKAYNLIISDISRGKPESGNAGLELPGLLMPIRDNLPPVIYYVHNVDKPLIDRGYPVVNYPSMLFKLLDLALN